MPGLYGADPPGAGQQTEVIHCLHLRLEGVGSIMALDYPTRDLKSCHDTVSQTRQSAIAKTVEPYLSMRGIPIRQPAPYGRLAGDLCGDTLARGTEKLRLP